MDSSSDINDVIVMLDISTIHSFPITVEIA